MAHLSGTCAKKLLKCHGLKSLFDGRNGIVQQSIFSGKSKERTQHTLFRCIVILNNFEQPNHCK